jgi:hypothetical protein
VALLAQLVETLVALVARQHLQARLLQQVALVALATMLELEQPELHISALTMAVKEAGITHQAASVVLVPST